MEAAFLRPGACNTEGGNLLRMLCSIRRKHEQLIVPSNAKLNRCGTTSHLGQLGTFSGAHQSQYGNRLSLSRFEDDAKAEAFERYLKSGSGHGFAAKHFWRRRQ